MPTIQNKRGDRADLDTLAGSSGLLPGEIYLLEDESRIAIGLTTSTYQAFLKEGEGGGGSSDLLTRSELTTLEGSSGIVVGQKYEVTDENYALYIGATTSTVTLIRENPIISATEPVTTWPGQRYGKIIT